MEKKLEVNNLQISFRTQSGNVKAVRNISFDLNKGETLAIVGESGSGKSVTSKAIIGILAGNSIVEGGEIIYDGQDLLKISEEDFHKIRGDKISMIFQDPMSSLNPIMRVGRQLTEAMILNAKSSAKSARKNFNSKLKILNQQLNLVYSSEAEVAENNTMCKTFDSFCIESTKVQQVYNNCMSELLGLTTDIDNYLFLIEKKQTVNIVKTAKIVKKSFLRTFNYFLVEDNEENQNLVSKINEFTYKNNLTENSMNEFVELLKEVKKVLVASEKKDEPNFFTLGYYLLRNPEADIKSYKIKDLNKMTREYLDKEFMVQFLDKVSKALENSNKLALEKKNVAYENAKSCLEYFKKDELVKKEAFAKISDLSNLVNKAIDRLALKKNSAQYSFASAIRTLVTNYFAGVETNPKHQAAFDKKVVKYNTLIQNGKKPTWQVTPPVLVDLELSKHNIIRLIEKLVESYEIDFKTTNVDYSELAVGQIDAFKEDAMKVVYKVTNKMAKAKAIKLLEEVGISEPAIRYNQYPFEFSGGMRQRIVIAIALAANPDVLICDEPTTALDVTIQSQILELINKLKVERNLSIIFITHDLGVVANMADRIAVMYAGKIVEYGTSEDIFYDPKHPYTWALLSSMPDLDTKDKLEAIPGTPPNMIFPPKGDAFADRNKYALAIDFEQEPPLFEVSPSHFAATWLLHPNAPKVNPPKVILDRIERMRGAQHE